MPLRTSPTQTRHFMKIEVYADQTDNDPTSVIAQTGATIASAGGTVDGLTGLGLGLGSGVNASGTSRRVERAVRRINENIKRAESGGYTDPRFKLWLDSRNQPNTQRARWQESLTTVLAMETGGNIAEDKEEPREEENPLKPDTYHLEGEFAALNRIYDVTVEGIKVEEQLEFGSKLQAYLEEHGEELSKGFRNAFARVESKSDPITSYINLGDGKWVVTEGTAEEVTNKTLKLLGGSNLVLTGNGTTLVSPAGYNFANIEGQELNKFISIFKQTAIGDKCSGENSMAGTAWQLVSSVLSVDVLADLCTCGYDLKNLGSENVSAGGTTFDCTIAFTPIGAVKFGDEVLGIFKSVKVDTHKMAEKIADEYKRFFEVIGIEGKFGHVLERHIGKTDDYLRLRIAEDGLESASTFTDKETFLRVFKQAEQKYAKEIEGWLGNSTIKHNFELDIAANDIGRVIHKSNLHKSINATYARFVIVKDGKSGYKVLTVKLSDSPIK